MKTAFGVIVLCMSAGLAISAAAPQANTKGATDPKAALIARGKYLVVQAGQCQDCHTPHDKQGREIKSEWLNGAPLPFKPIAPIPGWADTSLPIAGLPTMASDEEAVNFFMTAKHADGHTAAPPMPAYHFHKKDAEAIVAYLKSLDTSAGEKK